VLPLNTSKQLSDALKEHVKIAAAIHAKEAPFHAAQAETPEPELTQNRASHVQRATAAQGTP
jgi:hypothetical protein